MIRPYLSDIINDHKTQGKLRIYSDDAIRKRKTQSEWKIQLKLAINFIFSNEDTDEIPTMHIMMGSEIDKIIEDLFKSLLQRYCIVL